MKITLCDNCPYLDNECEFGSECDLDYDIYRQEILTDKSNEFEWHTFSCNCQLNHVITEEKRIVNNKEYKTNKTFIPQKVNYLASAIKVFCEINQLLMNYWGKLLENELSQENLLLKRIENEDNI